MNKILLILIVTSIYGFANLNQFEISKSNTNQTITSAHPLLKEVKSDTYSYSISYRNYLKNFGIGLKYTNYPNQKAQTFNNNKLDVSTKAYDYSIAIGYIYKLTNHISLAPILNYKYTKSTINNKIPTLLSNTTSQDSDLELQFAINATLSKKLSFNILYEIDDDIRTSNDKKDFNTNYLQVSLKYNINQYYLKASYAKALNQKKFSPTNILETGFDNKTVYSFGLGVNF
jgi:predicted porin